ncbi:MAG: AraC family transcriptional regulator [Treponema sp.]|jgi:AraC-like DNA-binding protein|nr:AraC family transcriptional regulator [Treponema sp.]
MADCFNDIEVLWISRFDYKSNWQLSPHAHKDFYQLIYCINGDFTLTLDGGCRRINSPKILFFRPGMSHGFIDISGGGLKTLDTKFKVHSRKLAGYCKRLPGIIDITGEEIYNGLERIRENGNVREILYEENCQLLLGQILIELIRRTSQKETIERSPPDFLTHKNISPVIEKLLEYIKNHYQEHIDAAILEREMHYSYRYLSKIFHQEMNRTPVEFIEEYKIFKAREMLKNTDFTIKYISEILAFSNVHQFSRSFKKNAGIPPGEWRYSALNAVRKDVVIHSGYENILHIKELSN